MKNILKNKTLSIHIRFVILLVLIGVANNTDTVQAEIIKENTPGKVYSFDKDSKYNFSDSAEYEASNDNNTYGEFSISGDIDDVSIKDDVTMYEVNSGNLEIYYTYDDSMINADEKSWHLISDKGNSVNGKKIDDEIKKGTVILQTSKDRNNWINVSVTTNMFDDIPIKKDSYYMTQDVQLLNGCYYRMIVVYETRKMIEPSKFLFLEFDEYEYKKTAEVYEFYAIIKNEENSEVSEQTHSLGEKVRTQHFDGYSGEKEIIKKEDVHYGWDLGQFFVSGYTDKVKKTDGDVVFLKNVGDKVTLWFNLQQNIDALNGNKNLKISADTAGYDEYFETKKIDFGRGTLIVRYTDYNDNKTEPQIYTNYLEANAIVGADTKVQLFEEGDYEIALDYEVTEDKFIDSVAHYRIFFKFAVRNGNCMVYPFDLENGSELTNSSMTDNGFRLDLAKSRYLKVNVKREVLTESADGLIEDIRFNSPAKDGEEYIEEGIYTITVQNEYTNQFTTKKIYVGTNKVLKAYMTTGLSIPEINNMIATGATISEDGTISMPTNSTIENELDEELIQEDIAEENVIAEDYEKSLANKYIVLIVLGSIMTCVVIVSVVFFMKHKKNNKEIER